MRRDPPANLARDAFVGTAEAYAKFRAPYPQRMLADLVERAGVGAGKLLDLATGPGRIALDLASSFETVIAVDLEPEMVAVGRDLATRRGISNITWRVGRAEDIEVPLGTIDLVTIGEAFHRLDQPLVARRAFGWLRPGCCLATLGPNGSFTGAQPWEQTISAIREQWIARTFPDGWGTSLAGGPEQLGARDALLRAEGFVAVEEHSFSERHVWTFEGLLGYLESTSVCSRRAMGDQFAAFEMDLRAALLADVPSLAFEHTIEWGYTIARKPRVVAEPQPQS
jgi:SAM-dependent methyltransferase